MVELDFGRRERVEGLDGLWVVRLKKGRLAVWDWEREGTFEVGDAEKYPTKGS